MSTVRIPDVYSLDRRILIQAKAAGRDEAGGPINTWVNVLPGDGMVWANILDLTGRQFVAAGGTHNAVQTEIRIRRRTGLVPSMRVLHGSVVYDIQAVLERDRTWLVLMCSKGVSNG